MLLAPGGYQTKLILGSAGTLATEVNSDPPMNLFRPSVDYLFLSLAEIKRRAVTAVLLTGMGSDGARGLLKLRQSGSWTIAQDEASSVVFGMPKAAIEMGAACEVAALEEISARIVERANAPSARKKAIA